MTIKSSSITSFTLRAMLALAALGTAPSQAKAEGLFGIFKPSAPALTELECSGKSAAWFNLQANVANLSRNDPTATLPQKRLWGTLATNDIALIRKILIGTSRELVGSEGHMMLNSTTTVQDPKDLFALGAREGGGEVQDFLKKNHNLEPDSPAGAVDKVQKALIAALEPCVTFEKRGGALAAPGR